MIPTPLFKTELTSQRIGLFVISSKTKMLISSDATNWTEIDLSSPGGTFNGTGAIVGDWGFKLKKPGKTGIISFLISETTGIRWSEDGFNWQYEPLNGAISGEPFGTAPLAYSNKLDLFVSATLNKSWTSTDGKVFTAHNITLPYIYSLDTKRSIVWSDAHNLFIGCGFIFGGGISLITTSDDGINWTERVSGIGAPTQTQVITAAYSNKLGKYVASGSSGYTYTSTDAINWTVDSNIPADFNIIWIDDLELFVGIQRVIGGDVITSPDGTNWTVSITGYNATDICYSKTLQLIVIVGNGFVLKSTDAINWTEVAITSLNTPGITYAN
jgi:hypothetical protein